MRAPYYHYFFNSLSTTSTNFAGESAPASIHPLMKNVGVIVEDVAGAAARGGVRQGDVIVAVNNVPIKSPEQLRKLVRSAIWNDVRASRTAPPARLDVAKDVR